MSDDRRHAHVYKLRLRVLDGRVGMAGRVSIQIEELDLVGGLRRDVVNVFGFWRNFILRFGDYRMEQVEAYVRIFGRTSRELGDKVWALSFEIKGFKDHLRWRHMLVNAQSHRRMQLAWMLQKYDTGKGPQIV